MTRGRRSEGGTGVFESVSLLFSSVSAPRAAVREEGGLWIAMVHATYREPLCLDAVFLRSWEREVDVGLRGRPVGGGAA